MLALTFGCTNLSKWPSLKVCQLDQLSHFGTECASQSQAFPEWPYWPANNCEAEMGNGIQRCPPPPSFHCREQSSWGVDVDQDTLQSFYDTWDSSQQFLCLKWEAIVFQQLVLHICDKTDTTSVLLKPRCSIMVLIAHLTFKQKPPKLLFSE